MTTFRQLLSQFEASAKTTAAKGRRFERFCKAFFETDPFWVTQFDDVWMWEDWAGRDGRADTGIDLVARKSGTDELVAVQCKFYSPTAVLDWGHVSTFAGMLASPEFSSGMIVSTAGRISVHVTMNLDAHEKHTTIWGVDEFEASRVDWSQFSIADPAQLELRDPKSLRPHQDKAITDVLAGFDVHDRGQMIMACGTGKTFTALRLAEEKVGPGGSVLFLVPSINLLSQSVLAWAEDATVPLATFAVCSDIQAGRRKRDEDMSANDLAFPASTDVDALLAAVEARSAGGNMTVIFSTYQSIDIITKAQQGGLSAFDLVICDEAHRTTGAFKDEDDQSMFTKVHDNGLVKASKRLYMTATPRVYGDQTKAKAANNDVLVASMDDEDTFGPEFHHLAFGDAVAQKLLTDYKVIVLAVNEDTIPATFQKQLADSDGDLALGDAAKIIGCWHGLSKRGPQFQGDNVPMQRAVAFSSTIKQSKAFTYGFPELVNTALANWKDPNAVRIETDHVDGSTNVKVRSAAIHWLEENPGQQTCRVLSNAKCLTEGVDVPALDAVLFLQPRKSIVDVVQAVGRVMRLAEDKDYGYVILPVGIPAGVSPEEALRDNKKYQVVWQVLQALRSHDERLAAEINKIDINKASSKISVIGIGVAGGDNTEEPGVTVAEETGEYSRQLKIDLPDLDEWREALYARIVEKVGDRRYMETWAADISAIAQAQETRIRGLLDHPEQNPQAVERFDEFLGALQQNLNDGVTRNDAIGMLSQHLITRPVFEALFGGDEFTRHNPVSQVMQGMLDELDAANLQSETKTLEAFYNHIQMLIGGIDTAEGRQRVITELYEKFFKKALPKTAESLGIVYTPIEIVDFIHRAVDELLRHHFNGTSLSDDGVHILDPFTGTGTFIVRLLQSGLIRPGDLERKYASELHANEIMLLAYYIAAVNIETAYQGILGESNDSYRAFDGIVLTDTFQLSEGAPADHVYFPRNNARADRQKSLNIRVIIGNPPYSVGQSSVNDANENQKYPTLDRSIASTYGSRSTATNKNSLYDSYIRAIRWASNRIQASPGGGVIGLVTNGGWLDGNTADGIRHSLATEFHHIYVLNLRGNQRTSGEQSRREGGKVFGQGSRSTVAITLLVKEPGEVPGTGGEIHYQDIGDYLTREEKLALVSDSTVATAPWERIVPNASADWINQRDDRYEDLIPLQGSDGLFSVVSNGLQTNRDAWVYNSSKAYLRRTVQRMVDNFNEQVAAFEAAHPSTSGSRGMRAERAKEFANLDSTLFSWDRADFTRMAGGRRYELGEGMIRLSQYRPFMKQHVVFDRTLNKEPSQLPHLFPASSTDNMAFSVVNPGNTTPFHVLATDQIPDLVLVGDKNCKLFARWRYETPSDDETLFGVTERERTSNLNPAAVRRFRGILGEDIEDDDVFFYVYGVLHSPQFRDIFAANLRKESPRVPLAKSREMFNAFSTGGQELCELHVGYEAVKPYPLVEEWADGVDPGRNPDVLLVGPRKMRYPKVADPETGDRIADRTRLIYNDYLTLTDIPPEAHDYVLGTRSGIDWIIDRWYVKTDKASGIVNDVNEWGLERGEPRYIIDLIKRVVTVSLRTTKIVNGLPKLDF